MCAVSRYYLLVNSQPSQQNLLKGKAEKGLLEKTGVKQLTQKVLT